MDHRNTLVAAITAILIVAMVAAAVTFGALRAKEINADQFTVCVQHGGSPSECRLAIKGTR